MKHLVKIKIYLIKDLIDQLTPELLEILNTPITFIYTDINNLKEELINISTYGHFIFDEYGNIIFRIVPSAIAGLEILSKE